LQRFWDIFRFKDPSPAISPRPAAPAAPANPANPENRKSPAIPSDSLKTPNNEKK
jgi:hypothetical protein